MPLFDPLQPKSKEAQSYLTCKQLIASIEEFWELADVAEADAASRVTIGPSEDPWDGEQYSIGDLEEGFGWCNLRPPNEDSFVVVRADSVGGIPEKRFSIICHFRRQVRRSEFNEDGGRQDVYLFFLDRTTRIVDRLIELSENVWESQQINRTTGPLYNPRTDWESQGVFLWVDFLIEVGTQSSEEE